MPALTELRIRAAKPREKAYKLFDERGLFLLITPGADGYRGRLWRLKYRYANVEKLLSLGNYPMCRSSALARSATRRAGCSQTASIQAHGARATNNLRLKPLKPSLVSGMKMGEQHIVPLSRQAVAVLRELHALTGFGELVFPSLLSLTRPMSNNTVNTALRRLGYTKEQMTGHGFRSMASTLLNEQGFPPDVIELQLAHAERNKVRAAYNKAQRLLERRKMMQSWADYLDGLSSGAH